MIKESVELYYYDVAILLLLILLSFRPLYNGRAARSNGSAHNNLSYILLNCALILLYLVFQFTETDYWSYWEYFISKTDMIEPLQGWIRDQFDNFFLWRLAVWGGAFIIFIIGFKRLDLNPRVYFPLFILCYISRFISREQLGIAIMFLGSTYIVKPLNKKILSYTFGILLISASYYFHDSMIISISMLIPAILRVDSKKAILILLLFVPLMSLISKLWGDAVFMNMFSDSSTGMAERIEFYSAQVSNALNVNGWIRQIIYWSPIILMLIDVITRTSKKHVSKNVQLPQTIQYYLNYWFYMFILSFVFFGLATSLFISVRFLDKSLFAMVVVLAYWFSIQKPTKLMRTSLWLFLTYDFLSYFLTIYKAS